MELLHINVQVYMYMYWYKLKRNIQGNTSMSLLLISQRVCVYIKAHHYKMWNNAGKSISLLFVIYIVYTCTRLSNLYETLIAPLSRKNKAISSAYLSDEWWKDSDHQEPVSCWLVLPSEHAHDHYRKLGVGFFLHCFIALGLNSFSTFMNYIFALYEGAIFFFFKQQNSITHKIVLHNIHVCTRQSITS